MPIVGATYDVVSNISSNGTKYTTTASYVELQNISLATGIGTTFLKASWDAGMNFSAPLYARFLRDGVSFGRFNLTQSTYTQAGSYEISFAETAGTHYYGFEVYSNKKGTIYSRNFSAIFLVNGTYGGGADTLQNTSISALQANDTYFNGTLFPNSTSFRNDTAVIANNTANLANTTANNAEPAISQGTSPQFWMFNKTWQNMTTSWITEGTGLFFTNARAISAVQSVLDMMNTSSATNNTNSINVDNIQNTSINALQADSHTKVHNDSNHTGSAKRNVAGGVAGIDIGGYIETTYLPIGFQNGIAGLNANAKVPDADLEIPVSGLNTTKANKSDIGEFTGGTIGSGRYGTGIVIANISDFSTYNSSYAKGGGAFSIENGTNVIAAGYANNFTTIYTGTLVKLIAHSAETGSINVSFYNGTTYIDSVVISSGTDGNKTLNYAFGDESLIRYEVTSVTDIKKVSISLKTTKS
jgi:hypothetical protein